MLAPVSRKAALYRMDTPQHVCPYGLRARALLKSQGFQVDDHRLTTREETNAFKAEHQVKTTPQAFINNQRIGGYDDLRRHFGKPVADGKSVSYWPIVAVFATAALMALAASWALNGRLLTLVSLTWFAAFSGCILAVLKLRDIEAFVNGFLAYDLLAQRWLPYAYVYPAAEALVGIAMIANTLGWIAGPLALAIGGIGATSVIKAVYVDRRDLKCACVGGGAGVPLGFISLAENLLMFAMGVWMLVNPMAR